jgi:hypothetical protein
MYVVVESHSLKGTETVGNGLVGDLASEWKEGKRLDFCG